MEKRPFLCCLPDTPFALYPYLSFHTARRSVMAERSE